MDSENWDDDSDEYGDSFDECEPTFLATDSLSAKDVSQETKTPRPCNQEKCTTCLGRANVALRLPNSVFCPHTLKQQVLLQLGNQFYGIQISEREKALEQLRLSKRLSNTLLAELQQVFTEMEIWQEGFSDILGARTRCYLPALHWHSHGIGVNWRKTGEMIVENANISGKDIFLISALCCLEEKVASVWSNDPMDIFLVINTKRCHPVIRYWVFKCLGRVPDSEFLEMIVEFSIGHKHQENLEYFWPLAAAAATDDSNLSSGSLSYLYDHSFHQAIKTGNKAAAEFICGKATRLQRLSTGMISAASCCRTPGSYYGFECAVAAGYTDLVRFLWQEATVKEKNVMFLPEHCKSFCLAAAKGSLEIVEIMWNEASKAQKFVLLFEQNAGAFRKAAGNGHLKIVKILWSGANQDQRRQLLGLTQGEALTEAAAKGANEVLEYLCSEMSEEAKDYFISHILATCISAGLENGKHNTVDFLLTLPRDNAEFGRVVWINGADVFWKAFKEARARANWHQVHSMFSVLNEDQSNAVIEKLESEYAKPEALKYLELLQHPEGSKSGWLSVDLSKESEQKDEGGDGDR